ncbi:MAG: YggT family protein [Anaerolineae bacterium]|nr:YggT family protein [Anaerolineae bacterium]
MLLAELIGLLIYLFSFLILARVLMSWVQIDPYHPLARFIFNATEPFLKPVRDVIPPAAGLDFSPIIVLVLAQVLGTLVLNAAA